MPIKFRCQHCRQFLGISRAKAGEVFDCPTCGWTIRVPELDGTIKPLPGTGLDLEDSKLVQALDELASIDDPGSRAASQSGGGTGVEGRVFDDRRADNRASGDWGSENVSSEESANVDSRLAAKVRAAVGIETSPEPIELPPLPAPEPIDLDVRLPVRATSTVGDDDSSAGDRPWRSTARAGKSWQRLLAAAEFRLGEGDSTDEPLKVADPMPSPVAEAVLAGVDGREPIAAADPLPTNITRPGILQFGVATWFALGGIGAAVFAAGFWIGRVTTIPSVSQGVQTESVSAVEPPSRSSVGAVDNPRNHSTDDMIDARYTAFRGRLTYRTASGERKAEKGARVIVVPVKREGSARLSVSGLRAGDQAEDQKLARAGIQTLGGDVATSNEDGEFEIKLSGAGQYYLLALSNSLSREEALDAKSAEEALARYFERPAQLLGRVMYRFEEVRYSGDGVTPWDYSFQP